jgi:UDP-N-acetylmuramyl pentapeptide phosphotransferase/UDP-N-acetylglucosamine-1-phosphate transferase
LRYWPVGILRTRSGPFPAGVLLTILVPGTVVFLLGIYDDIHSVGPYTKLAVQAVAAIMLFAGG